MKFKNFVKSLASSGVIYKRGIEDLPFADRWLASPTAMMLIPTTVKSVTAAAIQDMPQAIDKMIDQIGHTDYAVLSDAIMPYPDGGIKIVFGSIRPRPVIFLSRSATMTGS